MHNGILVSYEEEKICHLLENGTEDHHIKYKKLRRTNVACFLLYEKSTYLLSQYTHIYTIPNQAK